jgi:hypothetical protein
MRNPRIALLQIAAGFVFLAALGAASPAARAQMDSSGVVASKPQKSKSVWLKAEVIHVDRNSIMVREAEHPMIVHTFTFGTKLAEQMAKVQDAGGFQRGDKVEILRQPVKEVALAIKGHPSQSN